MLGSTRVRACTKPMSLLTHRWTKTARAKRRAEKRDLAPGLNARRFRPTFHHELLVCGLRGHVLAGVGAADLNDPVFARTMYGVPWHRCLRCDAWLAVLDPATLPRRSRIRHGIAKRDLIQLPARGRPLRDKVVLRLIAIDRAVHFLVLALLATGVLLLAAHRDSVHRTIDRIANDLQPLGAPNPTHHGFVGLVQKVASFHSGSLYLFGAAVLLYALIEGAEAVGLWVQARWAEYLTVVATALFMPYEVYELVNKATPLKAVAFVVNLLVVVYLLFAKRLFGLRGGEAAIEAEYARDVGWQALERSAPPFAHAAGAPVHVDASAPTVVIPT